MDKKLLLIPPNWENEGNNISLNKKYDQIIQNTFKKYISNFEKPMSVLLMPDKQSGYKVAENIFVNDDDFGLNLIRNHNSLIFEIHGSEEGLVAYKGKLFEPGELIQRFEDVGIIPDDINQIYTMSCYGGLQKSGVTKKGIPFESTHTSTLPTWGKNPNIELDKLKNDKILSQIELLEIDKEINELTDKQDENLEIDKKIAKLKEKIKINNEKPKVVTNMLDSGVITDKYKKEVIDNYKKYNIKFANANFIATEKEIEHALWYFEKPFEDAKLSSLNNDIKEYNDLISSYEELIESYTELKEFSSTEDIAKYDKNIDEFNKNINEFNEEINKIKKEQQIIQEKIKVNEPYNKKDWKISRKPIFSQDNDGQYYITEAKPSLKNTIENISSDTKIPINDSIDGQTSFIDNNGNIKQEYIPKQTILNIDINSKEGKEAYKNIALKKNNSYIAGFTMDDSMFIIGHGTKNGGGIIANNKIAMNNRFLGSLLLEENLVPSNVKNIYTISCYGGLQQPIELSNGIKIQSLHNSKQKIKFGLTLDKNDNVSNIKIKINDNDSLVKKFKNNTINVQMSFSPKEFNEAIINNKARHGALTPQEAFDKYGPNDDRFYTSQGLDPKKQKEAINKLNSKRKPPESLPDYSADDARLDKMFAEDKAYIESLEKQRKRPNYKPVKGPKLKETVKKKKYKPVHGPKLKETIKQDNNLEKATNEVFDNFIENINNTSNPKVKSTSKPSKNTIKPTKNTSKMTTKSLGGAGKGAIGLIIAGVTGLAIGKALSSNDDKDKKQDKQVAKQQNISYNNQYMDNQYTMQMAQDISSYRYGKHMTGFVNY